MEKPACRPVVLLLFALLGATGMAAPSPADPAAAGHAPVPLLTLENVPLTDAVQMLARQAGLNFILDLRVASVSPRTVNVRWTNATAHAALSRLLHDYKLTLVTNPATTVSRIAPKALGVKPVPASQVGTNTGAVIPLIVLDGVPLTEAITKLADAAQLKVSLDPKVSESADKGPWTVSFRWEKITARQALAALLDNYDLMLSDPTDSRTATITVKPRASRDSGEDGARAGPPGNDPASGEVTLPPLLDIEDYVAEQEAVYEEFTRTPVKAHRNRDAYVLTELWKRGLLKDEIKERLVRDHYHLVLVQIPVPLRFPNMEVRGYQTFPFPNNWTEFTPTLYVNDQAKWAPGKSQKAHAMSVNNSTLTSWSGGEFKNGDVLCYKIELHQKARGSLPPSGGKAAARADEPAPWEITLWSNKILLQGIKE